MKLCARPNCTNQFRPSLTTDKFCSYNCAYDDKKERTKLKKQKFTPPIKRLSGKRKTMEAKYQKKRIDFLALPENKLCPVTCGKTTDVHHKMGREGYADDWARDNNVPLLLDDRFWLAVSRAGHNKIEGNPSWAYMMGYSLKRTITHRGKIA